MRPSSVNATDASCSPRRLRYSAHPRITSDVTATTANPMANGTDPSLTTNIHVTNALRATAMAAIPACSRSALCPSTDASSGPGPPVPGTVRLSLSCVTRLLSMPSGYPASACSTRPFGPDDVQLRDAGSARAVRQIGPLSARSPYYSPRPGNRQTSQGQSSEAPRAVPASPASTIVLSGPASSRTIVRPPVAS
jgi:hypothetical protein